MALADSADPDEMRHNISSGFSLFAKVPFMGFPVYKELTYNLQQTTIANLLLFQK